MDNYDILPVSQFNTMLPAFNTTVKGSWKFVFETHKMSICSKSGEILDLPGLKEYFLIDIFKQIDQSFWCDILRSFKAAVKDQTGFSTEINIATPGGKRKWLRLTGIAYHGHWGKVNEVIGTIEDIGQAVSEESLGLSIINHELSTPLTIIKLNVQLLIKMLGGNISQQQLGLLKSVDMHVNSITGVMADYLTRSVNDQQEMRYDFSFFNIIELIRTITFEMNSIHQHYHFNFPQTDDLYVKADKLKIMQILINLMSNAVKFSPNHPQIDIAVSRIDRHVEINITDKGVGIPEGLEEQIFDKYYQAGQQVITNKNSKGLGLYLVKKIVIAHGGKVWAKRAGLHGSVFSFTLPLQASIS